MNGGTLYLDQEDRLARQRDFYLKLMPYGGHMLAAMNGMPTAAADSVEREARDILELWTRCQVAGIGEILVDDAWWMTKLMDKQGRMTMAESNERASELVGFGVAVVGQLIDKGILKFAKEHDLPEIKITSPSTPKPMTQAEEAQFQRLVAKLQRKTEE